MIPATAQGPEELTRNPGAVIDYRKLDPTLARALGETTDPDLPALKVFVRTADYPSDSQADFLRKLGVRSVSSKRRIFTATLSPKAVKELSSQPWVEDLTLSRELRPLAL